MSDQQEAALEPSQLELIPEGYQLTPLLSDDPVRTFETAEQVLAPGTDYQAVLVTNRGSLIIDLYQDETPMTVNNFVFLARHRFYDGVVFHRVLEDFMAQTGDPTGSGRGGPGYRFEDEIVEGLGHEGKGVLSMANSGPNTNGSQFFITFTATPWLDGRHTVFGEVIDGLEVLDELQRIDPQNPQAVVALSEPLSRLSEQGIELGGEAEETIEDFLTERLGTLPSSGQSFTVDGYTGVLGQIGDTPAVGMFPSPDLIETLFIVERAVD